MLIPILESKGHQLKYPGGEMTTLMAIGGAVDFEEPTIFKEFIKRAGGARARIVVLPRASGLADTGKEYCETFQSLGLKSKLISLEFRERKNANQNKHLDALRKATILGIKLE